MAASSTPTESFSPGLHVCPQSMRGHAMAVLRGEYRLPDGYVLDGVETVLDLGANVGAFSLWARKQWPAASVIAYEPHPDNATAYLANTGSPCVRAAVVGLGKMPGPGGKRALYLGRNNCGEHALTLGNEQTAAHILVECVSADTLAPADVVKLDTEGCELEILRWLDLSQTSCAMLEWHSASDRWHIGSHLASAGFECVRDEPRRPDRGVMVWVRS